MRAVFPFSDWRGYSIARAYYEAVRVTAESEKQHILPGNRFLPSPGSRLGDEEIVALLVRAWVLGRLGWAEDQGWTVLPATDADTPVAVGPRLSVSPQLAYRLAVDLVSSMNCFVSAKGPWVLRQRLGLLAKDVSNGSDPCGLRLLANRTLLSGVTQGLQLEAEWWERNTHPASNGWQIGKAAE